MTDFMGESDMLPPFFVLAFETNMKMQTIVDKLNVVEPVAIPSNKPCPAATPQPPIDVVCILGESLAVYQRANFGPLFNVHTVDAPAFRGWYAFGAPPLAYLLAWLHAVMPRQLRTESVVRHYAFPDLGQAKYMIGRQSGTS